MLASLAGWLGCLVVANERLRGLLVNSTLLTVGTLAISVPLGTLLAVAIAKTSIPGRRWLERCLIMMLFVPLYVQATAWQAAIGQGGWLVEEGLLAGWGGAIWIHGMAAVPWVMLFVVATLRKVPRELEEEALQDAAAWRVLLRVSMLQAVAGLAAASLWIAVICFSEITVTDLFRVRTFAEEIYTAASLGTLTGEPVPNTTKVITQAEAPAFATSELWLGTISVLLLILAALAAVWRWVPLTDFISPASDWVWRMPAGGRVFSLLAWLVVVLIVGIPLIGLLGKSGAQVIPTESQVERTWSASKAATLVAVSPWQHRREIGWSLAIASVATSTAVAAAVVIAWGIRTRLIPAALAALLLAVGFAIPGPLLGTWIIGWLNHSWDSILWPLTWCYDHTILAPVLAQFLRALPLTTLILGAQFASLPQDVLDSAESEGASWWQRLVSVALPWCWPAVVVATCMALIVSLGELAATLLVVPPGVSPLSVRIFGLLHYGAEDRVSALCLMAILAVAAALAVVGRIAPAFVRWVNRRQ